MYIQNWQADIRVQLDGQPLYGSWATYSGGDLKATDAKIRPGGMGKETSQGGQGTRADGTLTIPWDDSIVLDFKRLESRIGIGDIDISAQWMTKDKVAIPGALFGRHGTLLGASDPDYDHNGNAVGFLTISVGLDEEGT